MTTAGEKICEYCGTAVIGTAIITSNGYAHQECFMKANPREISAFSPTFDRSDAEAIFRFVMQLARHFAKKYGFVIKQWPEN